MATTLADDRFMAVKQNMVLYAMRGSVRCEICRHQVPTLKKLKRHYEARHSKLQLIQKLIEKSILHATPNLLMNKKRKLTPKKKTIYLHNNVQITYSKKTIIIKNKGSEDDLIELSFDNQQNNSMPPPEDTEKVIEVKEEESETETISNDDKETENPSGSNRKFTRRGRKSRKLFHIGFRKITEPHRSLDAHTGEFYECHCMENASPKLSSDTESGSDAGRTFYCSSCGNGYGSQQELTEHENMHIFSCRICNKMFNFQSYREHFQQHVIRIYVCHLCGFEYIFKDVLMRHLNYHFEQQTFEDVLDMEQDYNVYRNTNFSAGDDYSNINNILFFLTSPYDHYYSRNMFMKVVCGICHQEFYGYEYERHLKNAHFMH